MSGSGMSEELRRRVPQPSRLLVAAMSLGAVFLLWETRGQALLYDEWSFFADYRGHSLSILLNPFGDNIELIPS